MGQEILFHEGDYFFDSLIKECKRARSEILIEAFTFETDDLGKRLLKVLRKKAKEGVKVKVLIDGYGSLSFCPLLFKKFQQENFEIRFFNPLPFQLGTNKSLKIRDIISSFFKGIIYINKRNHRKTYIIDSRIAFVGSINITRLHSFRFSGERSWRDTGVKLKDERVKLLKNAFSRAWESYLSHTKSKENFQFSINSLKSGLRLNDGPFSRALQNRDLIKRINKANKRVWITNPYFVPTEDLIIALKEAVKRGVNVTIIIPRKSDMKLFPLINSIASRKLAEFNIKIFEYRPRILHSKIVMIDNWFVVGSSNMNSRSIKHDYEVDVVLREENNKDSLLKQFLFDLAESDELKRIDILRRYGDNTFSIFFIKLIKYWL